MATAKEMLEIAGSVEKAEKMARDLIKEKGDNYLQDLQLLLSLQGKFDESLQTIKEILGKNPEDVRAKYNYGWFLARDGKLKQGFEHMNQGRMIETWGNKHIGTEKPIWDGKGEGQHVLINFEAGIGDQLIFARFIKNVALKGAKPIVCCSPELISIFSRMPECAAIVAHDEWQGVHHDSWVPSMALPIVLDLEYENLSGFPYITANEKYTKKFKQIIRGQKLKIGIRWAGNPDFEHEQFRLFPKELMFEAVNNDTLDIYSLQNDVEDTPEHITNLAGFLQSWEDTAGVIANLDLVISSCTAVAHLAASMGKSTWVVPPIMPYWAWALEGNKSPWHNSVTLFRQEKFDNWESPFVQIKERIENVTTVKLRMR